MRALQGVVLIFSPPGYKLYMVGLAQLVRASGCGPEGRRFEPDISPQRFLSAVIALYAVGAIFLFLSNFYPFNLCNISLRI